MDDRPHYVGTSGLRVTLGLTWHKFLDYWEKDVIPACDATVGEKPVWLLSNVESIRERIAEYQRNKSAAIHNAIL